MLTGIAISACHPSSVRTAAAVDLGARARRVVDQHRGATRRTLEALEPFLERPHQQGSDAT